MKTYALFLIAALLAICSEQAARSAGGVQSVFGRGGQVRAALGDYTTSMVPEGVNQYFTLARSRAAISVQAPLAYDPISGVASCPTCGGGGGTAQTITAQYPLVVNSGVISCPKCAFFDDGGNLPVPNSLFTGVSGTSSGQIGVPAMASPAGTLNYVCSDSLGNFISSPVACR